jgi:hypothetical protein
LFGRVLNNLFKKISKLAKHLFILSEPITPARRSGMLEGRRVSAWLITLGERPNKSRRTMGAEGDLVLSELIGLLLRYPLTKEMISPLG